MKHNKKTLKVPMRYVPKQLSIKDKREQSKMLMKSRKLYKKGTYYTRKKLKTFKSNPSDHVLRAKILYNVDKIIPSKELATKTGCSVSALKQIVKKGEGAYYSSGSRPNQTAQSWGYARLASAITGGKSAAVDYNILENGCNHNKKAFILAKKSQKKYNYDKRKAKTTIINV
jgi:hypothetical protein